MVSVIAIGGEEERAELASVESPHFAWVDLGTADVLRRVGGNPSVDVGKSVKTADSGESAVDRRGRQTSLLHVGPPQLDMGPGGLEHGQSHIGAPLEKDAYVVAVGLKGASAVAGQVGNGCHLGLIEGTLFLRTHQDRRCHVRFCHVFPPR